MNRTDDELLALAAKAGGIDTRKPFAPLTDDGDALRLAVKLDLSITQWGHQSEYPPHVMVSYRTGPKSKAKWIEEHSGDAVAATRRAIVRAAAQIAEQMA